AQYNPGAHLAFDLSSMLLVAECIATAALARQESRGGHTRDDFPGPDPEFGKVNHVLRLAADSETVDLAAEPLPTMPAELAELFVDPPAATAAEAATATSDPITTPDPTTPTDPIAATDPTTTTGPTAATGKEGS
nr:hypothetical protein [Micromonospora sp. DSM 115978]